jgi:hypothetical protein
MLLKNYAFKNLIWILPLYLIQNIVEIVFFLCLGKPKIALTYVLGWWFNIKNHATIMRGREQVQSGRLVSDLTIMRHMYIGLAKWHHLFKYFLPKSHAK